MVLIPTPRRRNIVVTTGENRRGGMGEDERAALQSQWSRIVANTGSKAMTSSLLSMSRGTKGGMAPSRGRALESTVTRSSSSRHRRRVSCSPGRPTSAGSCGNERSSRQFDRLSVSPQNRAQAVGSWLSGVRWVEKSNQSKKPNQGESENQETQQESLGKKFIITATNPTTIAPKTKPN
jgi:hypothetical protein